MTIKNCTLVENGVARSPDAVTKRGQDHTHELVTLAASGHRTVLFFLVQRTYTYAFTPPKIASR